jgi:hypothetical protein
LIFFSFFSIKICNKIILKKRLNEMKSGTDEFEISINLGGIYTKLAGFLELARGIFGQFAHVDMAD